MGLRSWLSEPRAWEKQLARRGPWQRYSPPQRWLYAAFILLVMWGIGVATLTVLGASAASILIVLPIPLVPLSIGIIALAARPSRAPEHLRIARVIVTVGIAVSVLGVLITSFILTVG